LDSPPYSWSMDWGRCFCRMFRPYASRDIQSWERE
jgi:hypothetical protein